MAVEDVTGLVTAKRFLGVAYGHSGTGKTGWATSYPDEWGKALYFALDPDAHRLDSVLEKYRSRLHVLRFKGGSTINNMSSIVVDDWSKDYPDAGVMIVDTISAPARAMLQESANKEFFRGKDGSGHIKFGPKDAAITQSIPSLADYGGAKWLVENWLQLLLANKSDKYHIIVLAHEDYDQPRKDDSPDIRALGGPATFGRKLLSELPTYFQTVLRFTVDHKTDLMGKNESTYRVISSMQGEYQARIRENNEGGNPMPVRVLGRDGRPWWDEYTSTFMKGEQ